MSVIETIKERARADKKRVVFPEGCDARIAEAAGIAAREGVADVILLATPAEASGFDMSGVTVIDVATSDKLSFYANALYEKRKHKGMTPEQALDLARDPMFFGTLMLMCGDADGLVAGAAHTTADTLRPALQTIKTAPGVSIVSTYFIMETPASEFGENGLFIFADCGLNLDPNADELAAIAIASARSAREIAGIAEPRVAMLSYSTKGSAKGDVGKKMREAAQKARELCPELIIDGELQADAAIVPAVGSLKCAGSPVAGRANVLIFPDLQSGNIAYKLVERLAGAAALGPVCQGVAKPVNDLSRGCSVADAVAVAAITAVQAQNA